MDDYYFYDDDEEFIPQVEQVHQSEEDMYSDMEERIKSLLESSREKEPKSDVDKYIWDSHKLEVTAREKLLELFGGNHFQVRIFMVMIKSVISDHFAGKLNFKGTKMTKIKKKAIEGNTRNFLYNCIRSAIGEPSISLDEEEFQIQEVLQQLNASDLFRDQLEHKSLQNMTECDLCGSQNLDRQEESQKVTCLNCGKVNYTEATGITFNHLAQSLGTTKSITINGRKVFMQGEKGIQGMLERLFHLIEGLRNLFVFTDENIQSIRNILNRMRVKDLRYKYIKIDLVKQIIKTFPLKFKDFQELQKLFEHFGIPNKNQVELEQIRSYSLTEYYNEILFFSSKLPQLNEERFLTESEKTKLLCMKKAIIVDKNIPESWKINYSGLLSKNQLATLLWLSLEGKGNNKQQAHSFIEGSRPKDMTRLEQDLKTSKPLMSCLGLAPIVNKSRKKWF